jgi:hypothetical protein
MAHVAAGEALWRSETHLFDGVEVVKVVTLKEAIVHGEGRAGFVGVSGRFAAVSGDSGSAS